MKEQLALVPETVKPTPNLHSPSEHLLTSDLASNRPT